MKLKDPKVFAETVAFFFMRPKAEDMEFLYVLGKTRESNRVPGGVVGWPECRSLNHLPVWEKVYLMNTARNPKL